MIKYLSLVLFAGMIIMNYLANALPLNGKTTGELSNSFPNLFVPAGITFSIWGVIYLLLAVYCVVQFQNMNSLIVSGIGWFFAASCIFNALWIVCWHYGKLPLSIIAMLAVLLSLIYINVYIRDIPNGLIKAAFGIYLGWICIATIANVTALLVHYNLKGSFISEEAWTVIMIAAGTLIASLSIYRMNNPFIGLSVIWAFAGIIIKRQHDFRSIVIASALALVVVAIVAGAVFLRKTIS
jgi:hypothetical protein